MTNRWYFSLSIVLIVALLGSFPTQTIGADQITAIFNPDVATTDAIPSNFVAFSIEVFAALWYTSPYPSRTRQSFVNLIQQLQLTERTVTKFRIGGDSADTSIYNSDGQSVPLSGITYNITVTDILSLHGAMNAVNGQLTIGVNFRVSNNASLAIRHVAAIADNGGFNPIDSIEIGNEVDFYGGGYRPKGYNYSEYKTEWDFYVSQIQSAVKPLPIPVYQGLAIGGSGWIDDIGAFIKAENSNLRSVSIHGYGSTHCGNHVTTLSEMLSDRAADLQGIISTLAKSGAVQIAKQYGIPIVIGEGNSISCHASVGNNTVEVSFATALWSLDVMANAALNGLQRFHFHHGVDEDFRLQGYSSFVYRNLSSDVPTVLPLYYGMRMFAWFTASPTGSNFISSVIKTTNPLIKAFSVKSNNKNNQINILLIHKDLNATAPATATFSVTSPLASNRGECYRLIAPSAASTFGVSLAGQTYDKSTDGNPLGNFMSEQIQADSSGAFTISLPQVSAALCSIFISTERIIPDS